MYNPFTGFRVTQGFSAKHEAFDYGMDVGTPLPSCSDGIVTYRYFSDAGYTATITRADGSWTRYAHGKPWLVAPRSHSVKQGELVKMLSGNSGKSSGPHLHVFDVDSSGKRRPPFTTGPALAGISPIPITDQEEDDMPRVIRNTSDRSAAPNYPGDVAIVSPTILVRKVGAGSFDDAVKQHGVTDASGDARFIGLLNQYGWQESDWRAVRALGASNACLRPGGVPFVAGGVSVNVPESVPSAPVVPGSVDFGLVLTAIDQVPAKTRAQIIRD